MIGGGEEADERRGLWAEGAGWRPERSEIPGGVEFFEASVRLVTQLGADVLGSRGRRRGGSGRRLRGPQGAGGNEDCEGESNADRPQGSELEGQPRSPLRVGNGGGGGGGT